MKKINTNKTPISRRKILPILGSSFLIPFLGFGKTSSTILPEIGDEESKVLSETANDEYKVLLRKDGTTVKVKASILKSLKTEKEKYF